MYPYNIKNNSKPIPKLNTARLTISADEQTLQAMLNDAINDENRDFMYYQALSEAMPDSVDGEIVKSMSLDEYKHKRIFEEIYTALTGEQPTISVVETETDFSDIPAVLLNRLFDELESVEMYRDIMSAFEDNAIRDMLFEIITDEQSHADILNYLIHKNSH